MTRADWTHLLWFAPPRRAYLDPVPEVPMAGTPASPLERGVLTPARVHCDAYCRTEDGTESGHWRVDGVTLPTFQHFTREMARAVAEAINRAYAQGYDHGRSAVGVPPAL